VFSKRVQLVCVLVNIYEIIEFFRFRVWAH
jgi:hypothetical protein